MEKYLFAVGDIVGDENMLFAGKNNDLVKIFLSSEAEILKLYENHPQIVINDKVLTVRKIVNNGHKIFPCNTEPGMPDSILIHELSKYTKILSPLRFVNLGFRSERFAHLHCLRRSAFVNNVEDLPHSSMFTSKKLILI